MNPSRASAPTCLPRQQHDANVPSRLPEFQASSSENKAVALELVGVIAEIRAVHEARRTLQPSSNDAQIVSLIEKAQILSARSLINFAADRDHADQIFEREEYAIENNERMRQRVENEARSVALTGQIQVLEKKYDGLIAKTKHLEEVLHQAQRELGSALTHLTNDGDEGFLHLDNNTERWDHALTPSSLSQDGHDGDFADADSVSQPLGQHNAGDVKASPLVGHVPLTTTRSTSEIASGYEDISDTAFTAKPNLVENRLKQQDVISEMRLVENQSRRVDSIGEEQHEATRGRQPHMRTIDPSDDTLRAGPPLKRKAHALVQRQAKRQKQSAPQEYPEQNYRIRIADLNSDSPLTGIDAMLKALLKVNLELWDRRDRTQNWRHVEGFTSGSNCMTMQANRASTNRLVPDRACTYCEEKRRICASITRSGHLDVRPLREAIRQGKTLSDEGFWKLSG